jgi:hypothetical protein
MSKTNGKSKGNSFERKIANLLSERFKDYLKIEKGFRRNPDSGSFFGGINESRTEIYGTEFAIFGDLICPKQFRFSIECKHYKSAPSFQSIISKDVKDWDKWLNQAEQDSKNSEKELFLIIKYNNTEEIVFLNNKVDNLEEIFVYKGKYIYNLNSILKLDNIFFF